MHEDTARYADIFTALGSEPRLEIMRLLFAAYPDGMIVGDIQAKLKIPNSTLSHHLEKLRVEGLVNSRKDKQYLWYSANAQTMEDLLSFLYTGRTLSDRIVEPSNNTSTQERFMFEQFFESIFDKLFGFIPKGFPLPSFLTQFTEKALTAMRLAQNETRRLGHQYVGTEQILIGLISEGSGLAWQFLNSVGVNLENVQIEEEKIIGRGKGTPTEIPLTPKAKKVMELSLEESQRLGHNYIGTEHLLLGLLHEREGLGAKILQNLGVDLQNLEQRLRKAMS